MKLSLFSMVTITLIGVMMLVVTTLVIAKWRREKKTKRSLRWSLLGVSSSAASSGHQIAQEIQEILPNCPPHLAAKLSSISELAQGLSSTAQMGLMEGFDAESGACPTFRPGQPGDSHVA